MPAAKSNKKVCAVAARAADLLEQGHCKKAFARTACNLPCMTTDPNATKFCYAGAINRAMHDNGVMTPYVAKEVRSRLAVYLRLEYGWLKIENANDYDPQSPTIGIEGLRAIARGE